MNDPTLSRFHPYRDHEQSGAWGVRDDATEASVGIGMDRGVAIALALLLNGNPQDAWDAARKLWLKYQT